jgi:hypothetical protein
MIPKNNKVIARSRGRRSNLIKARTHANVGKKRLLRGVYPDELEGLAMTLRVRLSYAK